jgi:hypothetical protein
MGLMMSFITITRVAQGDSKAEACKSNVEKAKVGNDNHGYLGPQCGQCLKRSRIETDGVGKRKQVQGLTP